MGEFDLIDRAFRRKAPFRHALTRVANGDDASVHAMPEVPAGIQLVVSTDMSVAGVHWPHDFPLEQAAKRAVHVALSDLAAMGAEACWVWVCAALADEPSGEAMGAGVAMALDGTGIELAGGDTVCTEHNSLSVTVAGLVPGDTAMRRDAAGADHEVWLLGSLGSAALALERWQQGDRSDAVLQGFADVKPLLAEGVRLRKAGVRSCIDVSDGLLADARHITETSGVGMEIELSRVPSFNGLSRELGEEKAAALVLGGGEDYALLCTAPTALHESLQEIAVCIGGCTTFAGEVQVRDRGKEIMFSASGFDHFG